MSGDFFYGQIYMGEYLNATFTERKCLHQSRRPVRYPKGLPWQLKGMIGNYEQNILGFFCYIRLFN
jgi:hypothetical protein